LANFSVIVQDDKGPYAVSFMANAIMNTKFTITEETSKKYKFILKAGSDLFDGNHFIKNIDNAYNIFNFLTSGKLGGDGKLKYEDLPNLVRQILEENGISKSHPTLSYEILVAELAKTRDDSTKPFRFSVRNDNRKNGYIMTNIRDVPRNISPFSALASEDITEALASIIQLSKENKKGVVTPLEQIALNKF
jgi:hypothetical protein